MKQELNKEGRKEQRSIFTVGFPLTYPIHFHFFQNRPYDPLYLPKAYSLLISMLEEYEKKRHFEKTSEPSAHSSQASSEKPIFVVQRHDARNLHYDFRLEMDGVLKSWAVPKEPPKEAGTKRLAIQTEDHPLAYANFEGEIPEGEYGAGKVEIWDKGTFELQKRQPKEIIVTLYGNELKGDYVLIKTKYGKEEKGWLFFKKVE